VYIPLLLCLTIELSVGVKKRFQSLLPVFAQGKKVGLKGGWGREQPFISSNIKEDRMPNP
jgi:hypothetical protein